MNYIDAHSHVWTPDTLHYPLAAGYRRAQMDPTSFTVEELQKVSQPCGVKRVVLIQMSFYGHDNSYMLDTMAKHPGLYSGVAVIDQNTTRASAEMKQLKQKGVRGFRIYPQNEPYERWLDGAGLQAMFETGAKENLAMCCLIDAVALKALSKACEKFPETPVVIDHLCRIGAAGPIRDADVDALCAMAKHKKVTVKASAFYALGKKKPPYLDLVPLVRRVLDAFGPERVMWASDCPFQVVDHTYQQSLDLILHGCDFLSASDRDWLLRKTAERVYFS